MRRWAAAALVAGMASVAAMASIAPPPPAAPAAVAPVVSPGPGTSRVCVWRIAFRAPARLYYGCQWTDTLATSTNWIDLEPAQLAELAAFAAGLASGTSAGPLIAPSPAGEQQPTLCDRYWLWASDEGARAPEMTRERKIRQACREVRP